MELYSRKPIQAKVVFYDGTNVAEIKSIVPYPTAIDYRENVCYVRDCYHRWQRLVPGHSIVCVDSLRRVNVLKKEQLEQDWEKTT